MNLIPVEAVVIRIRYTRGGMSASLDPPHGSPAVFGRTKVHAGIKKAFPRRAH